MERNFLILSHNIINVTGYRHIPGWITFSTHGWDSKNLATANPFFMCSFILTCRVFRPLFTKKLSKGEGTAPKAWIIKMVCSSLTFKLGNSLIYMYRYPYFLCISFLNSHFTILKEPKSLAQSIVFQCYCTHYNIGMSYKRKLIYKIILSLANEFSIEINKNLSHVNKCTGIQLK